MDMAQLYGETCCVVMSCAAGRFPVSAPKLRRDPARRTPLYYVFFLSLPAYP